jgi:hypothetical protein
MFDAIAGFRPGQYGGYPACFVRYQHLIVPAETTPVK